MTNYFVGVRRPGTAVRDIQDILTDMDEVTAYADSQASVRRLIAECNFVVPNGLNVGSGYWVQEDGSLVDGNPTPATKALALWHLDPANYALPGKNLGLLLRASCGGNDIANANGIGCGVQLQQLQFTGVSGGNMTLAYGSVAVACGPSAGFGWDEQVTGFPTAGWYGIMAWPFQSTPAGYRLTVNAQIYRYQDTQIQ